MRKLMSTLGVLALLLVACGNGGKSTSSTSAGGSTGSTAANATTGTTTSGKPPVKLEGKVNAHGTKDIASSGAKESLEVEADDFYFEPTYVRAAPKATVSVTIKNEGKSPHTFTIESLGIDQTVQPGETRKVDLTLPSSGAIRFACRFHEGSGMQGAFFFNAGDSVAAKSPATTSGGGYPDYRSGQY